MAKRKLRLEELAVESAEMLPAEASRGTVHGAQQTFYGCPPTLECMYPTANPSCPATATQGQYSCAYSCMVPRTDFLACCTQGECTIYICSPI
jgi:hypothetical protein